MPKKCPFSHMYGVIRVESGTVEAVEKKKTRGFWHVIAKFINKFERELGKTQLSKIKPKRDQFG